MNNNETMIQVALDPNTVTKLERFADMIDRRSSAIAKLISKDTSFHNERLQKIFDELCTLEADYSEAKNDLSNTIASPRAVETWGESVTVNWSIDFASRILTIVYNGMDNRETEVTDIEITDDFIEEQRNLSVKRTALGDVIDRVIQTTPNIDNQSYDELEKLCDEIEDKYQNNIKTIDREYVRQWFENNHPESLMNTRSWTLDFNEKKVTVSYSA